jgi:hypothetical protein
MADLLSQLGFTYISEPLTLEKGKLTPLKLGSTVYPQPMNTDTDIH